MGILRTVLLVSCCIGVAACTSGAGTGQRAGKVSSAPPPVASPPPPAPAPTTDGGYLYGTLGMNDTSGSSWPIAIILTADGRFRALEVGPDGFAQTYLLIRGDYRTSGRAFDGEGLAIASPGDTWADGTPVTPASISGTLDPQTSSSQGRLLLTVSLGSGETGGIDAKYVVMSPYYYRSDLERLEGSWVADIGADGAWYPDRYVSANPQAPQPRSLRISVTADGGFSGADDDGCAMSGAFSLIDTRFSVWSVDYAVSGCARAGDYSGLAVGDNHWYSRRSLHLSVDDGRRAQALELWQAEP